MKMTLIKNICFAMLSLLLVACSSDTLDDHRGPRELPVVTIHSATLEDGFTLVLESELLSDGGSLLLDLGLCYNESEAGDPHLDNAASKTVRLERVGKERFVVRQGLAPEKLFNARLFAVNTSGIAYSNTMSVETPIMNLDQLLVGTFVAKQHQSYYFMEQGPYPNYDVQIKKGPVFMGVPTYTVEGLKVRPGSNERLFTAQFEVHTNITDSGTFYKLLFPQQLTGVTREVEGRGTMNVMMINGSWLTSTAELETDMHGHIDLTNGFELVLPLGYAFVYSDPFTDELGTSGDDIVDLVLGTLTFDESLETDKRAECRISKKY